jgi:aspartyl/asparaginyl beta-hydroxylase (cupin superfamily)
MLRLAIGTAILPIASSFVLSPRAAPMWVRLHRSLPVMKDAPVDVHSEDDPMDYMADGQQWYEVRRRVAQRFIELFTNSSEDMTRVLEYYRRQNTEYEGDPDVFIGDPTLVDPAKSNCVQNRFVYIDGLTAREFWDPTEYAWCQELKSKYQAIRDEFFSVVGSKAYEDEFEAIDGDTYNIQECTHWTRIDLMEDGNWLHMVFPVTAQAVHDAKVPAMRVRFAILPPNDSTSRHTDLNNFVLTSQLAIDIPYSGENKCRLEVGDSEKQLLNGEMLLFDSTIYHKAVNDADKLRVVLLIDVWHPELSEVERQALQFDYDVFKQGEYDLVSRNKQRRCKAEEKAAARKVLPQLPAN